MRLGRAASVVTLGGTAIVGLMMATSAAAAGPTPPEVTPGRLKLQSRASDLQDQLRAGLADDFVQLRFDNAEGRWVLAVAPSTDLGRAEQLFTDEGFEPREYRVERATFTADQLRRALRETRAALKEEVVSGIASVGIGAGRIQIYVDRNKKRRDA